MLITSSSNPKIKEITKLRDGKYRRRTGLFLIDGLREINRAVQCGIEIQAVFGTNEEWELLKHGGELRFPVTEVSPAVLEKITFGSRDDIIALAKTPEKTLETFECQIRRKIQHRGTRFPGHLLIAVLEKIEKPGNIGAVFRSADGAGFDGVILADSISDLFNSAVIRNSAGTVFDLPAAVADTPETVDWLKKHNIGIAVARCEAAIPYTDYDFRQPSAVVLGNEANGLTERWQGSGITAISLPMLGIADSLNVSNAAAVLFYEARRQRSTAGLPSKKSV